MTRLLRNVLPDYADRALRVTLCAIVTAVFGVFGALYATTGIGANPSPNSYRIVELLPGHMRTHGLLMFALAVALLYGLVATPLHRPPCETWLHWALVASLFYALLLTTTIVGSAVLSNDMRALIPAIWWTVPASITAAVLRPPTTTNRKAGRAA